MSIFKSLSVPDDSLDELKKQKTGPLFHTIEYEISDIVKKIENIDNLDIGEIKRIIIQQHQTILNYDLFLMSDDTRRDAQILFTNIRFLQCFLEVIRLLNLSYHEKICINKLAYDYYILPNNDQNVSDLLYQLTTEVNSREVTILSGILGIHDAKILAMIRNSSFKAEKSIHRVNTFIVKSNQDISVSSICSIYSLLFERFSPVFTYTMLEYTDTLTQEQKQKYDSISIALLEMLNTLPENDIKKVLFDYNYMYSMRKDKPVRFRLKTAYRYKRILDIVSTIEITDKVEIL